MSGFSKMCTLRAAIQTHNQEACGGPNAGEMQALVTGSEGKAVFYYTGLGGGGDDELTASGDFGGVPFSCATTVRWISDLVFDDGFESLFFRD